MNVDPSGRPERGRSRWGLPGRGTATPRRPAPTGLRALVSAVTETVTVVATALVLSLLLKTFLVQAFSIPSGSMEDTLLIGDRVLVSKLTPGPFDLHRGDVVVFKDPGGWLDGVPLVGDSMLRRVLTTVGLLPEDYGEHLIKRVIGLPGDTVACCDAQGRLTVNGAPIEESYVRAGNKPSDDTFSATVKAGNLWVMGDNRSQSEDSRRHTELNDGQVPLADVVGKAFVIVWPLSRLGGVDEPPSTFAKVPSTAPAPVPAKAAAGTPPAP